MFARAPVIGVLLGVLCAVGCSAGESSPAGGQNTSTRHPTSRPEPAADPGPDPLLEFSATVARIGPRLRDRMSSSHHPGCPVRLADLRYLRLSFVGFGGAARTGELVVHETRVEAVVDVFHTLYDQRWPIRRMRLVDDYGGDDGASMSANNTSGYNCRRVAGADHWSQHSFGRAIDINPVQNPYVVGTSVAPEQGRRWAWVDRSPGAALHRGVIRSGDAVVSAFERVGWTWGGDWVSAKDYQHFEPPRHVRRLRSLGRMESCQGTPHGDTRLS